MAETSMEQRVTVNVIEDSQNSISGRSSAGRTRMANLELLRCVAMMMVIVLHYLDKGQLLADLSQQDLGVAGMAAWLLEAFCIVAVNVYMLISGYFLCTSTFKVSRLIQLYLQVWIYSVGVGVLAVLCGALPMQSLEVHDLLTMLFPVSMGHYWFITAYVFMYLLLPFVGSTVQRMSKKQMQIALCGLLLFFCVFKSVLPIRLEKDAQGYDCLWYLCVFFTAAYFRRFGMGILKKLKHNLMLYIVACLSVFGLTMGLRWVYLNTGSLGRIMTIALEYNHILPYLAAIGMFGIFLHVNIDANKKTGVIIKRIAPFTLGVYLLHENIGIRGVWPSWLGAGWVNSTAGLLLWTVAAVAIVFTVGILVDMLRTAVMRGLHAVLMKLGIYRRIVGVIEVLDKAFAPEKAVRVESDSRS